MSIWSTKIQQIRQLTRLANKRICEKLMKLVIKLIINMVKLCCTFQKFQHQIFLHVPTFLDIFKFAYWLFDIFWQVMFFAGRDIIWRHDDFPLVTFVNPV